jgi:hypothetical protein
MSGRGEQSWPNPHERREKRGNPRGRGGGTGTSALSGQWAAAEGEGRTLSNQLLCQIPAEGPELEFTQIPPG